MAGEEFRAETLMGANPGAALGLLLTAWRKTFDPALGRLIDALGSSLVTPLEGLPIKKGERAAALAKRAQTAPDEERSAVLAAFEDFAREAPGRLVWPSIEAWAVTKPDPRVARMALRVLTAVAHGLTAKLWRRLVNCIEQHGDLGVVEDARAYEATITNQGGGWGYSPERFSNVLKKLTKSRQCSEPADGAALARMLERTGARAAPVVKEEDPRAMLEAIGARPDDDAPRLVYADWLSERKQPAGEFIVLQIARRRRDKTATKRVAELLATQRKALLGPFDGVVAQADLRFERGFVAAARFVENVPAHPFTRLLQRLEFDEGFEEGARFDSLMEARGPNGPQRDSLPSLAPKLTRWDVVADDWKSLLLAIARVRLEALTLRGLEGVELDRILAELFAKAPGLKSVELFLDRTSVPKLVLTESLDSVIVRAGGQFDATFTRGEKGWAVGLSVTYFANPDWVADAVVQVLAPFPAQRLTTAKIELPVPPAQRDRFGATIAAVRKVASAVQWGRWI